MFIHSSTDPHGTRVIVDVGSPDLVNEGYAADCEYGSVASEDTCESVSSRLVKAPLSSMTDAYEESVKSDIVVHRFRAHGHANHLC